MRKQYLFPRSRPNSIAYKKNLFGGKERSLGKHGEKRSELSIKGQVRLGRHSEDSRVAMRGLKPSRRLFIILAILLTNSQTLVKADHWKIPDGTPFTVAVS